MILIYLIIGFIFTLFMVFYYRSDGQTKRKYELYFAVLGPVIWPIQLITFITHLINRK